MDDRIWLASFSGSPLCFVAVQEGGVSWGPQGSHGDHGGPMGITGVLCGPLRSREDRHYGSQHQTEGWENRKIPASVSCILQLNWSDSPSATPSYTHVLKIIS